MVPEYRRMILAAVAPVDPHKILGCLNVMNLRSPLIFLSPTFFQDHIDPYRETLDPIQPRGGVAQVQVHAQMAVARMHAWLDRALVLDADIAHTGQTVRTLAAESSSWRKKGSVPGKPTPSEAET